jgi:ligand-binding sensor domain-containing protein
MSRIYLFILVFFQLLIQSVSGQQAFLKTMLTSKDLDNAKILSIYQDKSNLVWIGTESGLYTYNGLTTTLLEFDDSLQIAVSSIYEDSNGYLWVGTQTGEVYKLKNAFSKSIDQYFKITSSKISAIIENDKGELWIGTYGDGLFHFEGDTIKQLNTSNGLSDDYIYTLIKKDLNKIWAGTDNGISICSKVEGKIEIEHLSVEDGLPDFIVKTMALDKDGNIWIGMHDKGICYYSFKQMDFIIPQSFMNWGNGPVEQLLVANQTLWIGSSHSGILQYDIAKGILRKNISLNNNDKDKIHSFLNDREGNIWLATHEELIRTSSMQISHYKEINNIPITNIHAILADKTDHIWLANDRGLFRFNPNLSNEQNTIKHFPLKVDVSTHKIMCLYQDNFGFIWVGTFGNGIIRLNPEDGSCINITEKEGLINGNVLSVSGSKTQIWFATLGGAVKCAINDDCGDLSNFPKFQNFGQNEGLINSFIYDVFVDSKQRVWFATDGNGLLVYENDSIKIIDNDLLGDAVVYSISEDAQGKIWFNSLNTGLYSYEKGSVTLVKGTEDLSITALLCNDSYELVILHNNGLDVLNLISSDFHSFREEAGIHPIEPDLNTLTMDSKGEVWAGTNDGIILYSSIQSIQTSKPKTQITSVKVLLEDINPSTTFEFPYDQNHFTFQFQGLWYQQPEKVKYQLKLVGHDLDWIDKSNNTVIYSSLSPGEYEFMVRSSINDNFENAITKTYAFHILKPFWITAWFYLIIAISIIALLIIIIKIREQRLKRKQEILHERIRYQYENLRSQINPHFLFNSFSTLIALIDLEKDKAIEYVSELSQLFRNILEYQDRDIIPLSEELIIIDNYIKIHKKRHGDSLNFEIIKHPIFESIKLPPMTLQLLIENAIKHNIVSTSKPLYIRIYYQEDKNLLIVENNLQSKADKLNSTGIGLHNIADRYKLLTDQKIHIEEKEGFFKVGLPIIK